VTKRKHSRNMIEKLIEVYWSSIAVGFVVFVIVKIFYKSLFPKSDLKTEKSTVKTSSDELSSCDPTNCCRSGENLKKSNGFVAAGGESDSISCKTIDKTCSQNDTEKVVIIYGTTTGKSELFSKQLSSKLKLRDCETQLINASTFGSNIEDKMKEITAGGKTILVVIISTYTEGSPPDSAKWFYTWLSDMAGDFRVSHNLLSGVRHAAFGLGNSLYSDHYNTVARDVDQFLNQLGSTRIHQLGLGDENVAASVNGSIEADFEAWSEDFISSLKNNEAIINVDEKGTENGNDSDVNEDDSEEEEDEVMDIEDLAKKPSNNNTKDSKEPKEMVTPLLRKTLTKQGYKIIGTHSGVKLCRWTKSMLRGRGGCYKHTFYGIDSHRCMEATPSLACANKCVFCWRHHSNPVGTEWRWKMESAEFIFSGAVENHRKMINEFKGVPGVLPDKLEEGMTVKHCALSLVGEPIMYPEINKFVRLLHNEAVSSFLVTNAQFPDAIRDMDPCTQLYVSVDASTKESLKKIDRPLFKDFWERFLESLKELKHKGQRTVYRLTLVKGWNAEEMDNYAKLVELGQPDFIEIKGVTFCGSSKASTLTMENVPWHTEVVRFVNDLVSRLADKYDIASEHEHSNCVLVAHKKFNVDNKWLTWIDYDKFHELIQKYYTTGDSFSSLDYMAETPSWAVFGAKEQGFDPNEKRWYRKGKAEVNVDGGCG